MHYQTTTFVLWQWCYLDVIETVHLSRQTVLWSFFPAVFSCHTTEITCMFSLSQLLSFFITNNQDADSSIYPFHTVATGTLQFALECIHPANPNDLCLHILHCLFDNLLSALTRPWVATIWLIRLTIHQCQFFHTTDTWLWSSFVLIAIPSVEPNLFMIGIFFLVLQLDYQV